MDNQCPLQYFITEPDLDTQTCLGKQVITFISSINMRKAWEYFHASVKETFTQLCNFREIYGVRNALINAIGTGRIDGAYDKIFCKMILSSYPLRLLPPYSGAHEDEFAEFIECKEPISKLVRVIKISRNMLVSKDYLNAQKPAVFVILSPLL